MPAKKFIELFQNADASTIVHKWTHWYLDKPTRIAKYNEAKRKSDALVNSMFGSVPTFNFNLTSNKSVEPNEAEEVNNTNNMQKEIDAARVTMRKTAYEKYMNNLLEKGQITREQYYDASLKVQEQENEKLTGKSVIKEKYIEIQKKHIIS